MSGETELPSFSIVGMESPITQPILPNGKKTKGRVKIKMEYIGNKLRRYTTFSKRKTGIMKKVSFFYLLLFSFRDRAPSIFGFDATFV